MPNQLTVNKGETASLQFGGTYLSLYFGMDTAAKIASFADGRKLSMPSNLDEMPLRIYDTRGFV